MPRLLAFAFLACSCHVSATDTPRHTIVAAGVTRSYSLYVPAALPPDQPAPLVFVFHGSGGDGASMESFSEFSILADRERFMVVYPDAISQNWNDGREANAIPSQAQHVDDVAFVGAMIREIGDRHRIDAKRIFATGFSNGGIFVHYLAARLSAQIAAIADVSGSIAEPLAPRFKPAGPVSVFMIHGTADPFVPYNGGNVDYNGFGRVISTTQTVEAWQKINACVPTPTKGTLPDSNAGDQCRVNSLHWLRGKTGAAELLLYSIEGGGHAWPGGPQFLPVEVIGHVCRDFDASAAIWEFFKNHSKP